MRKQYFHPNRLLTCLLLLTTVSCSQTKFAPVYPDQETFSDGDTPSSDGQMPSSPSRSVAWTEVVAESNKQVDFLLVLDDSNSMAPELKKLSARLSTFVSFLEASQIDWQMCVTTTRASDFGSYLNWKAYTPETGVPSFVLKKGASGLNGIFTSTINSLTIGGGDSSDERAIKAAYVSFQNQGSCYRPGAAVSVIAISDEDERSLGGDISKLKKDESPTLYKPLEAEDLPQNLMTQALEVFGEGVRFTFNSIIVKPGDNVCESAQDEGAAPSHPGYLYAEMSALSNGGVGSICDTDYGTTLNTFKDKIVNSLNQVTLQCEPVKGSLKVLVNGLAVSSFKVEKKNLKFALPLIEGTRIDLTYDCKD